MSADVFGDLHLAWMRADNEVHDRLPRDLQRHDSFLIDNELISPEMLAFQREEQP